MSNWVVLHDHLQGKGGLGARIREGIGVGGLGILSTPSFRAREL